MGDPASKPPEPGPSSPSQHSVAIIPACNEEATIGSVVLTARAFVEQVVVIDDGSRDRTAATAEMAGAVVLRHDRNAGKGRAMATGLEWARKRDAKAVVFLDGDGQHDPNEIPLILKPVLEARAELVIGVRYGDRTEMPWWRRIGKRTLDYSTAAGSASAPTDSQSGFRAIGPRAIRELRLREAGFGAESEMVMAARREGWRIAEVPVRCLYGNLKGSSQTPIRHAAGVLAAIVKIIGERHPLLVLGVPGLVLFLSGTLLAVRVVDILQRYGAVAIGTAVLASLFILAGLTMGLGAVILHVLPGAIAKQIRNQLEEAPKLGGPQA